MLTEMLTHLNLVNSQHFQCAIHTAILNGHIVNGSINDFTGLQETADRAQTVSCAVGKSIT